MRVKLAFETLGTFFLCLAVTMTEGAGAPLLVAALLCALVYVGGPVSGAHYNPAVSLAFRLRGRMPKGGLVSYVFIQLLAATAAGLLAGLLVDYDPERAAALAATMPASVFEGFLSLAVAETLGTGLLVFVILMVATSRLTAGNGYYGVAIALTVLGAAGMFSANAPFLNPAVTLASQIKGPASAFGSEGSVLADFAREWTFLAKAFPRTAGQLFCQLLGATLAARLFLRLFPEER